MTNMVLEPWLTWCWSHGQCDAGAMASGGAGAMANTALLSLCKTCVAKSYGGRVGKDRQKGRVLSTPKGHPSCTTFFQHPHPLLGHLCVIPP